MEGGERKRLKLIFSSPQKLQAAPPRGKHRVCGFGEGELRGIVTKSSTTAVKALLDPSLKVRELGPLIEEIEDSPPSPLLEIDADDQLRKLEKQLQALVKERGKEQKRLSSLETNQTMVQVFLEDGQYVSLGAFVDKILELFYEAAGKGRRNSGEKGQVNFDERSKWLFSRDAEEFVDRAGNLALLQEGSLSLNMSTLNLMQNLKKISSKASSFAYHSSKPIQVAYALEKLPNIDASVFNLFENCFGMNPKAMIKRFMRDGSQLDSTFTTQFHVNELPASN